MVISNNGKQPKQTFPPHSSRPAYRKRLRLALVNCVRVVWSLWKFLPLEIAVYVGNGVWMVFVLQRLGLGHNTNEPSLLFCEEALS